MEQRGQVPLENAIEFFSPYPTCPAPRKASRDLDGSLPLRAVKFCEPVKAASGAGCLVYSPLDVDLIWDGSAISWREAGTTGWKSVERVHLPGLRGLWLLEAADKTSLASPPAFLDAPMNEPGYLQVWSGLFAKTRDDWHLWVRGPVNAPRPAPYQVLEGVIETDWWFGPLVTQIRFLTTNRPIQLRRTRPLLQVIPVPSSTTRWDAGTRLTFSKGVSEIDSDLWASYEDSMAGRNNPRVRPGSYQREVHDRRKRSSMRNDDATTGGFDGRNALGTAEEAP